RSAILSSNQTTLPMGNIGAAQQHRPTTIQNGRAEVPLRHSYMPPSTARYFAKKSVGTFHPLAGIVPAPLDFGCVTAWRSFTRPSGLFVLLAPGRILTLPPTMVGQTCRFAPISPPASAAMLAEPWGYVTPEHRYA